MAKRGAEVGDVKNEEGRAYSELMSQGSNVGNEQQVNDMQGVMSHSSNTGITQQLEDVSVPSYGIGATTTQSCVKMEPKEISITQLSKHEVLFVMVFPEAVLNDVKDAYAHFGDMRVQLKKKNDFNLIGAVPDSLKPGKVQVRVTSSAGDQLGETWFEYLDEMPDMFERLMGDPDLQRSFFALWNEHQGRQ